MFKEPKYKEALELFLEEVEIAYGKGIKESCREKIDLLEDIGKCDLRSILEDAKKEWKFNAENSSLAFTKLHFNS